MKRNRSFKDYFYSSPWLIVAISVAISNILFLVVAWVFRIEELGMGLIISTLIPLIFGIPASRRITKHHHRLIDQNLEMQRLYALTKRIVSKITKEIETPLLSMQKDLTNLLKKNSNSELVVQLNSLEHKLGDMQQNLDQLLRWSKNEVDKENLAMEVVSAGQVIHPIVDYMDDIIREKELKVKLVSMDEPVRINIDMYNFIFRSIVEPAFKDSQNNSTIEVSVRNGSQVFDTIIRDKRAIEQIRELEQMNTPDSMDLGKHEDKSLSYSRLLTAIHYIYSLNGKLFITRNDEGINTTIIQLPH